MPWNMVEVREQRTRFVVRASEAGRNLSQLCRESGISRPTGYRWLRRWEPEKVAGLEEKSRRPQHSPRRTPAEVEGQIVELRRQRPDWGARKLQPWLAERGIELPVITVHRVLLRHELVRPQDRHPAAVERFERATCNALWQMDFKSPKALGMRTPASVWRPRVRRYPSDPPEWEYGSQAEVHALNRHGRLQKAGRRWPISRALRQQRVEVKRVGEHNLLVYYCQTLVRVIDLAAQRSTAVDCWAQPANCKGCGDNAAYRMLWNWTASGPLYPVNTKPEDALALLGYRTVRHYYLDGSNFLFLSILYKAYGRPRMRPTLHLCRDDFLLFFS